jgi:8-oxo-dGTP diphosphatase
VVDELPRRNLSLFAVTFKYCPVCAGPLKEKYLFHASRLACTACGFIFYLEPKVVTVVVVEYEGKLLLGRRNIDPGKGLWSFFSGYMERGEKVELAAIREVKEETNLDVHLGNLIGIYSELDNPHVVIAFRASVANNDVSEMIAQPDEVSELALFLPEEAPQLAFPTDIQILRDWYKTLP